MRTKTLLLTAAIGAAGLATSMAQTVYSVNAVGYVNQTLPNGFSLVANPLIQAAPTINNLLPSPPPGTTIYKYVNGEGYRTYRMDPDDLVWLPHGNDTLDIGDGFFIFNNGAQFTLTWVGEVAEGNPLTTPIPAGFSMRSSKVPQAGTLTALGMPASQVSLGDTVYKYVNGSGYQTFRMDPDDAVWVPSEPTLAVGEAMFYFNNGTGRNWTRTFDVTP